jgi:probable F420-dependent oxidoreductase
VKIGFFAVGLANLSRPEILAAAATTAEEAGMSTLWTGEHIVFVEKIESDYPYARTTTKPPVQTDLSILNPFVALSYAAAVTKTIRLATGVCLVPEYNPLLLAKLAASVDFLSKGRLVFGTGIGWMKEEYEALGIPWERRARRYRESIEAMRRVWEDATSSYSGELVSFFGVRAFPKPVRRIPVIMGGQTDAALKRAASYGDGWCGFNINPDETKAHVATLDRLLAENGRTREGFEIFVSPLQTVGPNCISAYEDAGVDELYLAPVFATPFATVDETTSVIAKMGREWVKP